MPKSQDFSRGRVLLSIPPRSILLLLSLVFATGADGTSFSPDPYSIADPTTDVAARAAVRIVFTSGKAKNLSTRDLYASQIIKAISGIRI